MSCVRNATRIYLPLVISSESIRNLRKRILMNYFSGTSGAYRARDSVSAPESELDLDAMGEAELDLEDMGDEFEFTLDD